MKIDPNAPAHPEPFYNENGVLDFKPGLTIRAEFAKSFMPNVNSEGYDRSEVDWYATTAIEQADALIAALNRREP